ncbi:MAG: hypothetical protein HC913_04580 [Microscillaceae bacterium]|nr:hypothetical protein [Microscillaceae bacterium]
MGDHITLYADANGSYEAKKAISIGRLLEDHGVAIFEEPCPFEQYEDNQAVAKALRKIKIAGGEQDTSLARFDWICRHRAWDILQPDVFYCGGILRLLQIAKMAWEAGLQIAPHSPKADPLAAPMLHVAALIPNLYGFQEVAGFSKKGSLAYLPAFDFKGGKLPIPQGPGLGVQYDFEK